MRGIVTVCVTFALISLSAMAQTPTSSPVAPGSPSRAGANQSPPSGEHTLSLYVLPDASLPIADSAELFTFGGGARVGAEYGFGGEAIQPYAGAGLLYSIAPFKANDSLSIVSAEISGGTYLALNPRLLLRAAGSAGYYYGLINSDGTHGSNLLFSAGLGVTYLLTPLLDLSLGASYRNYLGLYHGVAIDLGTSVYLSGRARRSSAIEAAAPIRPELLQGAKRHVPGHGVEIEKLTLDDLFPVFRTYYDDHAVGRVVLVNREETQIDGIKLTFFMKQYMDNPKECPAPEHLGPKESLAVNLVSLFTDRILEVTEATKASAEVVLEYRKGGELYRDVKTVSARVLDRNAMTWNDDRHAAAFVTAKDPWVLSFSKAVSGLVREKGPQAVNANLLQAMAMFKALDLYGLAYVVDPKSSYSDFSAARSQVDYLQFPRQTLEFRGGDCDDLSILFTALLESVGVETAFITIPGHIYAAFNLGMTAKEAAKEMTSTSDLIERDGTVWVPVEVTERKNGFLAAWQTGAKEWRDGVANSAASLIPIRTAWKEYQPVGLPGPAAEVSLPPSDAITAAFLQEAVRYVDREIFPMVSKLQKEIKTTGGSPTAHNRLGILYAKYGKLEDAESEFTRALGRGEYIPALVNLGNVYYLRKDLPKAQTAYERASREQPSNCAVLVNLTKIYHEQEKYELASAAFVRLRELDQAMAERYAYLGGVEALGTNTARAGVADQGLGVVWDE